MSVGPEDLLRCARDLLAAGGAESHLRASMSRAYYAAFHGANSFHNGLSVKGRAPSQASGSHYSFLHRLQNPGVGTTDPNFAKSKKVAIRLQTLRLLRVKADYGIGETVTVNDARQQLVNAERLIGYLNE